MITFDDVRRLALALPETTEGTHFRMPSFEVAGKHFVVVQKTRNRALLFVNEPDAQAAIAEDPAVFETERPGRPFGLWIDLTSVTPKQFERTGLARQGARRHALTPTTATTRAQQYGPAGC